MLIDVVEPILDVIKTPTASTHAKQVLKRLAPPTKIGNITTHTTHISLQNQIPMSSLLTNGSFVPQHIVNYIERESKHYVTHEYVYKGRMFKIIMVYATDEVERKKDIEIDMCKWLTMIVDMGELADNCGKTTTIYCYLTPFKKELPAKHGEIVSYNHANSAVTTACSTSNEICIFREEEMFKVFIHETFHAFNLDFSLQMGNTNHSKQMKQMFNIKSEFNLYETYAETWAEIINIVFLSGHDVNVANKMLQAETAFSLHQMNNVLAYMGLDYNDLLTNAFQKYKEETNVFCYYVLKSIVLFYWSDFIEFCNGLFKYTRTVNDFIGFIREKHKTPEFIAAVQSATNYISGKTMRMTLWEN
jgi:hypothetical protein